MVDFGIRAFTEVNTIGLLAATCCAGSRGEIGEKGKAEQ